MKRSDRLIWMKLDLSGEVGNIISVNSPQTRCDEDVKAKFWKELDEELSEIPDREKVDWVRLHSMATAEGTILERKTLLESMEWAAAIRTERPLLLFMSHDLRVVNTFFQGT